MFDQIIAFVLNIQFLAWILILIGLYAVLWWSIDNLKSIVQIVHSLLVPYFQPQEVLKLSERFGNWAGKLHLTFLFFCIFFPPFLLSSCFSPLKRKEIRLKFHFMKQWKTSLLQRSSRKEHKFVDIYKSISGLICHGRLHAILSCYGNENLLLFRLFLNTNKSQLNILYYKSK